MSIAQQRTGVLVIRVWIEPDGGESGLRARLTQSLDVASGQHAVGAAAGRDDICDAVRSWLEWFLAQSAHTGPDPT